MQISMKLRQSDHCYVHYCPGCHELHLLPKNAGWTYGNVGDRMTASPSFKHSYYQVEDGVRRDIVCHYILTNGILFFCDDCTHTLRGNVELPELPTEYCDFESPVNVS